MFISLAGAVTNLYAGPSEKRFEGEWASHKDVDFSIHLHQDGNQLTGYHSAVTKDASRTDTAPDGEGPPSITGTVKGDTAIVDVHSTYSDAVLKVRLTLHDRSLDWKVLQVKQSGDYYIPDKATLSKEH
ncbi:MAG TPA: hypothetical protein VM717_10525 [Chthoniobacterales bacterium]|jgi:hypothetical protein|nr:hypothetical protein [Chthoniobacterales bacterium]